MNEKNRKPAPRSTYRHGDLRRALLDAGIALARDGGPTAVVLREATRRAGVAPNAAYRHFASREDLLAAVRAEAVAAVGRAMEAEYRAVPADGSAAEQAHARVRAVGRGYLRFAFMETGLFRTAFGGPFGLAPDAAASGASGHNPFGHLNAALDALVAAGAMPPERRPGAEFLAWSTVHGLALLALDGPLQAVPSQAMDALGERLLDMVERGI
jgi:AcrR family transcriptional regulator